MKTKGTIFTMIVALIEKVYSFLWGDLIHIPLPGGGSVGISLLIILLIPTGIYFTVRTRLLPIRMFPDMIKVLTGKKENKDSLSTFQTLIVSTATRVGMGNLVGVVAGRRRCGFLDVDNSHYRFIHGFCGGYTGTASQGAGSIVLRLSWRSGVLHTPLL